MCAEPTDVFAFTLSEFGKRHGLSRSLIYQLIKRGDLHVTHYSDQSPRITRIDEQHFLDRIAARNEERQRIAAEGRARPVGRPRRNPATSAPSDGR